MNNEAIPPLVLTAAYGLHLLATVLWVGGLAAVSLLVIPAARRALDAAAYGALLTRLVTRLQGLGWFSLAVLVVTGMFQMSASPQYEGMLQITNNWATAILIKHLVIGGMIVVSAYVTWGVMPGLQRMALITAAGKPVPAGQVESLRSREELALKINLILAILVLLLTAWARSSV